MKKAICLIISILIMCNYVPAVAENGLPLVYIADVQSVGDKEIVVSVAVSNAEGVCGGSMNLLYDPSFLRATAYRQSDMLTGYIFNANLSYAEDTLRFSWAGSEALPQNGVLLTVTFERLKEESFESEIVIDKLKLGDVEGNKISGDSENGTVKYVKETATVGGGGSHTFRPKPNPTEEPTQSSELPFTDVREADWFYGSVKSAFLKGLMQGMSGTEFAPNAKLTRAMFVTILYRVEGSPETERSDFTDVTPESWYADAVGWAGKSGIVNGLSETRFAPQENITREQMATVIYRYLLQKEVTSAVSDDYDLSGFEDAADISEYALPAIRYCAENGILTGKTDSTINPKDDTTRAETATVLARILQSIE